MDQGWKYRLVIDNRSYIFCFSIIDYRRLFAFIFLSIIAFSMFLAYKLSTGRIFIHYFCSSRVRLSLHQ